MVDPIQTHELFEEDEDLPIEELDDGSAVVVLPEDEEVSDNGFYSNLANTLEPAVLRDLSTTYQELIKQDREARKKRDEQYEEGLRRTGLGNDAPGGADFVGAATAVHPVLAEGCVDFAARAIKELFPPNGPVKTKIIGTTDEQLLDKAKRKRDFLNLLLTQRITEFRAEKEILLTQLPLGGSQYEKYWVDMVAKRIRMEFVPIDKVLLPYSAASFYASPRVTHVQEVTRAEFEARVKRGFYRDVKLISTQSVPDETASEVANDKIEGLEADAYNVDGLRSILEISCTTDMVEDGEESRPYIIHLDEATGDVLAVYRNWAEDDNTFQRLDWWVEDKFIPWRGAYGIGLPHLIGGLAASLTGSLRALLDSAHISNSPGAVKLKGGRASGQNIQVPQTSIVEVDAPSGVDDIRKVMMPLPFNPPSPVLFQLMEWISQQAKGVVATAEEKIADVSQQMPVGTTLALIEQGSQVFSSIHSRLHEAQARAIKIICRLVNQYPDLYAEDLARFQLTPQDFADNDNVEPVSDPRIFSETQRYAQLQEVLKVNQLFPEQPWNRNAMARRSLELLHVDYIDEILPKPPEPVTADPVSENVALMRGAQLKAVMEQDHQAHIQGHLAFIINPLNTALPGPMPQLGGLMAHIQEHMLMAYEQLCMQSLPQAQQVLAQSGQPFSPDQVATLAANIAAQKIQAESQQLAPLLQQAGQVVQQKMPPPQVDPAIQKTFEAAMAEVERKKAYDQEDIKLKQNQQATKAELEQQKQEFDQMLKAQTAAQDEILGQLSEQVRLSIANLQQATELRKNSDDNRQHQLTEVLKNVQDNQTARELEGMRLAASGEQGRIDAEASVAGKVVEAVLDNLNGGSNDEQAR